MQVILGRQPEYLSSYGRFLSTTSKKMLFFFVKLTPQERVKM